MSQQISLRIQSAKCIDETNGACAERWGNEKIWSGGCSIASKRDTQYIALWEVYVHFDDGDMKALEQGTRLALRRLTMPDERCRC